MNKTQKIALSLAGILTLNTLSGCGGSNNENANNDEIINKDVEQTTEIETTRIFSEGEHFIRYEELYEKDSAGYVTNVLIPEGYEVVDIETTVKVSGYGSRTDKILYFYVNNIPVEVEGVIDEEGNITYPNPGRPVDKSLTLNNN